MTPVAVQRQHYGLTLAVLGRVGAVVRALADDGRPGAAGDPARPRHASTTAVTWVLTIYLLTASIFDADPRPSRRHVRQGAHAACSCCSCFGARLAGRRAVALDRRADRRPRDPGRRRRGLPALLRDHPRRVPAASASATGIGLISATFGIGGGAGLVLSGMIVDHLAYEWIFWLRLLVFVAADRRHPPVRPRVADQDAGEDRLGRAPRCCRSAWRALLLGGQRGQRAGAGARPRSLGLFAFGRDRARGLGPLRAARRRSRSSTCG